MKKLILAVLTGVCIYALIVLAGISLGALGAWLYGGDIGGDIFVLVSFLGLIPALLIGGYVYGKVLS